jgi:hypothetical protein
MDMGIVGPLSLTLSRKKASYELQKIVGAWIQFVKRNLQRALRAVAEGGLLFIRRGHDRPERRHGSKPPPDDLQAPRLPDLRRCCRMTYS